MKHTSQVLDNVVSAFLKTAVILLAVTSLAKVLGLLHDVPILSESNLLLPFLSNRQSAFIAAALEACVCGIILSKRFHPLVKLGAVSWVGTIFFVYKVCLRLLGVAAPCGCLGRITDWMQISPRTAEWLAEGVLIYLLGGSLVFLLLSIVAVIGGLKTSH